MKKSPPFEFVLDELDSLGLHIKPMFGAYGVYKNEKILFVLRKKEKSDLDTGIWFGVPNEYISDLKKDFPILKDLTLFGKPPTAWQVLRESEPEFEEMAFQFCKLIKNRDPRIGRIPKAKAIKRKKSK